MPDHPFTCSVRLASGVWAPAFRDAAVLAEQLGFDQIWTGNDLFRRSGIVPVTLALAATSTIRVGNSVLNPVTLHPAEIAMLVQNLQDISGGRYLLGLGAGSEVFLRWAGLEPDSPVARTSRGVRIIRTLLAGRSPAELGERAPGWHERAVLEGGAVHPTPIYVGAMGPRMLRMAGREADGVLALCLPPELIHWVRERVDEQRDPNRAFDLMCCLWVSLDDDADAARARLRHKIATYSGSFAPESLARAGYEVDKFRRVQALMTAGDVAAGVAAVDDEMLGLGIAGNRVEVVERCAALIDAGVSHLSFAAISDRPVEAIGRLGEQVIPDLRRLEAAR